MWPVNLRVYPPKKLDLRVARKSTTSPLPDYVLVAKTAIVPYTRQVKCPPTPAGSCPNNNLLLLTWTWWRHQMETFSASLALCAGKSPVIGEFPSQRPVAQNFGVFFELWNGWANNRDAGDLRRHCVTVMPTLLSVTAPEVTSAVASGDEIDIMTALGVQLLSWNRWKWDENKQNPSPQYSVTVWYRFHTWCFWFPVSKQNALQYRQFLSWESCNESHIARIRLHCWCI